jgi:hypothetical protein
MNWGRSNARGLFERLYASLGKTEMMLLEKDKQKQQAANTTATRCAIKLLEGGGREEGDDSGTLNSLKSHPTLIYYPAV